MRDIIQLEPMRSKQFIMKLNEIIQQKIGREVIEQLEIEIKYDGYIRRQEEEIKRFEKFESMRIPENFDYVKINAVSNEGKEKLQRIRPSSIGQASRISGVTSSDVSVLMVHLRQ